MLAQGSVTEVSRWIEPMPVLLSAEVMKKRPLDQVSVRNAAPEDGDW